MDLRNTAAVVGQRIEVDGVTHVVSKTRGHGFTRVQTIDETMPEDEYLARMTRDPDDPTRTIFERRQDEALRHGQPPHV